MIDLGNSKSIAPAIETVFPLMFEQSKNVLPEGIKFDACDFWRPPMNKVNAANNVVGDLLLTRYITDGCNEDVEQDGSIKVKIVDESSMNCCIKSKIEFLNLKWRQQLETNNRIHLHERPFLLARPEVKSKFSQNLNIIIIDAPTKIWRPKINNRYIHLDY